MMTEKELADLRQWAAQVCGYTPQVVEHSPLRKERIYERGAYYIRQDTWEPDQNIAQAFEVWDAVLKLGWRLKITVVSQETPCNGAYQHECGIYDWENHKQLAWDLVGETAGGTLSGTLALAITKACRTAVEALKGTEHGP